MIFNKFPRLVKDFYRAKLRKSTKANEDFFFFKKKTFRSDFSGAGKKIVPNLSWSASSDTGIQISRLHPHFFAASSTPFATARVTFLSRMFGRILSRRGFVT